MCKGQRKQPTTAGTPGPLALPGRRFSVVFRRMFADRTPTVASSPHDSASDPRTLARPAPSAFVADRSATLQEVGGPDWRLLLEPSEKQPLAEEIRRAIRQYVETTHTAWPPSELELDTFQRSLRGIRQQGEVSVLTARAEGFPHQRRTVRHGLSTSGRRTATGVSGRSLPPARPEAALPPATGQATLHGVSRMPGSLQFAAAAGTTPAAATLAGGGNPARSGAAAAQRDVGGVARIAAPGPVAWQRRGQRSGSGPRQRDPFPLTGTW